MKKLALISAIFIAVGFMSGCNNSSKATSKETKGTSINAQETSLPKGVYYTCEMDPDVHSDKPGDCPKCGMKLIRSDSIKK
jgi:hypothetical protein